MEELVWTPAAQTLTACLASACSSRSLAAVVAEPSWCSASSPGAAAAASCLWEVPGAVAGCCFCCASIACSAAVKLLQSSWSKKQKQYVTGAAVPVPCNTTTAMFSQLLFARSSAKPSSELQVCDDHTCCFGNNSSMLVRFCGHGSRPRVSRASDRGCCRRTWSCTCRDSMQGCVSSLPCILKRAVVAALSHAPFPACSPALPACTPFTFGSERA